MTVKDTAAMTNHAVAGTFFIKSITVSFQDAGLARQPFSVISIKAETPQCCSTG